MSKEEVITLNPEELMAALQATHTEKGQPTLYDLLGPELAEQSKLENIEFYPQVNSETDGSLYAWNCSYEGHSRYVILGQRIKSDGTSEWFLNIIDRSSYFPTTQQEVEELSTNLLKTFSEDHLIPENLVAESLRRELHL